MAATPDRTTRLHIALAAGVAGAQAFAMGVGGGVGDSDPYRHFRYASELWRSGFSLRGHPFLPFTILGRSGVDLWWGFHLLLIPFTAAGFEWGVHLAATAIAAASAGGLAWVMARLGQVRPAPFALLPLLTSAAFAYRGHVARPAYLTIPLIFCALAAGVGRLRPWAAAIAGFVHGAIHLSSPLSPLFAALGAMARGRREWRDGLRATLAAVAGLAICFVVRPDRAHFLSVAWRMSTLSLGLGADGHLPAQGGELVSPPLSQWLLTSLGGFAALALAAYGGQTRPRVGAASVRVAALLAVAVTLPLSLHTGKFLDYFLPSLAVAAAVHWPKDWRLSPGARAVSWLLALGIAGKCIADVPRAWSRDRLSVGPPEIYPRFAEKVRGRVPPGSMLFVNDWSLCGILYEYLPSYAYPLAYDPAILYASSPELFWTWLHATQDGTYCPRRDLSDCSSPHSGPDGVSRAMRAFGAEWLITVNSPSARSLFWAVLSSPEDFERVETEKVASETLTLWHLHGHSSAP